MQKCKVYWSIPTVHVKLPRGKCQRLAKTEILVCVMRNRMHICGRQCKLFLSYCGKYLSSVVARIFLLTGFLFRVSSLLNTICSPEDAIGDFQDRLVSLHCLPCLHCLHCLHWPPLTPSSELEISPEKKELVKSQLGNWSFAAHQFSEDDLTFAACEMLTHSFNAPGLEPWRLSQDQLRRFILACRTAYNSFVLYHNFRHAVDVMQSVFCFLLHSGALASYGSVESPVEKTPLVSILTPFDALTLLISAIGHDVGHPGVNNVFLIKLNTPLAQLYNDSSVLEAFHCAAFSQILRRHWPSVFKEKHMRKLLINSILATDMGIHQNYMSRLESLQQKFHSNNRTLNGWDSQEIESYRVLVCGLLIKCADISNVARPWDVAEEWTRILQLEFANQGEIEKNVGLETALFGGPPELGNVYKLAVGQIGFMSFCALPLFTGVSDIIPHLSFTVEQIQANHKTWHDVANREREKEENQKKDEDMTDSADIDAPVNGGSEILDNGSMRSRQPGRNSITYGECTVCNDEGRRHDTPLATENMSSVSLSYPSSLRNSSTQRHSMSTRSNTAVASISPETHTTSLLTMDSGDETICPPSGEGITYLSKERPITGTNNATTTHDEYLARPTSSSNEQQRAFTEARELFYHTDDGRVEGIGKGAITATVIGNSPPHHATVNVNEMGMESGGENGQGDLEGDSGGDQDNNSNNSRISRKLLKRRSFLRLAFWKRRGHFSQRTELRNEM